MTISETTAAVTTDSIKLKPRGALTILLAVLLFLATPSMTLAQTSSGVVLPFRFNLEPAQARVYQGNVEGRFDAIGLGDDRINIELLGPFAEGKRDTIFRFSVSLWFGREYPSWGQVDGQPKDQVDLSRFQVMLNKKALLNGQTPTDGSRLRLPLPPLIAFQAWTLAHPVQSFAGLLIGGLLLFAATRWRTLLARVVPPSQQERDDSLIDGAYRLGQKIGEGGMGEVWAATSVSQLNCALKFLRKELLQDPEAKRRVEREIKACLPLTHPNLLKMYGWGWTQDGRMYTVSELLVGRTLKEVIQEGNFDPPQLATKVLEQAGDALHYLHIKGLAHRDVKPDNIFVCDDGTIKVMDMGLIRGQELTVVTRTGFMVGTPAYMPPEQMDTHGAIAASDQYSLGVILYEILAGRRPFLQPDPLGLAYHHMHVAPAPPSEIDHRIPPEVEQAILRMLNKKPEDRFGNLKKAQRALEAMGFMTWRDSG